MADIFLSYTEADRARAGRLADALQAAGFSVWWDRRIPAGSSWRTLVDRQLQQMRCMVVCWSARSVQSDWVCEEAAEARALHRLVPVLLERVRPPAGFREVQAADLVAWDGSAGDPGFTQLLRDIEAMIGAPAGDAAARAEAAASVAADAPRSPQPGAPAAARAAAPADARPVAAAAARTAARAGANADAPRDVNAAAPSEPLAAPPADAADAAAEAAAAAAADETAEADETDETATASQPAIRGGAPAVAAQQAVPSRGAWSSRQSGPAMRIVGGPAVAIVVVAGAIGIGIGTVALWRVRSAAPEPTATAARAAAVAAAAAAPSAALASQAGVVSGVPQQPAAARVAAAVPAPAPAPSASPSASAPASLLSMQAAATPTQPPSKTAAVRALLQDQRCRDLLFRQSIGDPLSAKSRAVLQGCKP